MQRDLLAPRVSFLLVTQPYSRHKCRVSPRLRVQMAIQMLCLSHVTWFSSGQVCYGKCATLSVSVYPSFTNTLRLTSHGLHFPARRPSQLTTSKSPRIFWFDCSPPPSGQVRAWCSLQHHVHQLEQNSFDSMFILCWQKICFLSNSKPATRILIGDMPTWTTFKKWVWTCLNIYSPCPSSGWSSF